MHEKKIKGERIKIAAELLKLSFEEVAKRVGVSASTISNWVNGRNEIYKKNFPLLAKALNTTEAYLVGETDDPNPNKLESDLVSPVKSPSSGNKPTDLFNQTQIIQIPKQLKRGEKVVIDGITYQGVPIISWASAGAAKSFYDVEGLIDIVKVCPTKDPNAFGIIVEGESMEPLCRAGYIAIVEPNSPPRKDDLVVARLLEDGGVLFKQIKRTGEDGGLVQLLSINPNYPCIERPRADFRFIYPVVEISFNPRR